MDKRTDILNKINEMINDGVIDCLKKESERLARTGAIDYEDHEYDTYVIPKIILTVALENAAKQYYPFDKYNQKAVKNLRHF